MSADLIEEPPCTCGATCQDIGGGRCRYERVRDAVEGECDGLAITVDQARAIVDYAFPVDALAAKDTALSEMRAELDARLDDLGRVIMACPMSPETRTSPAHIGVRVLRDRLEAAEAQLERARKALKPFAGDKMPLLRRSEIDYDRNGLRRYMSPMEIAMRDAARIASQDGGEER